MSNQEVQDRRALAVRYAAAIAAEDVAVAAEETARLARAAANAAFDVYAGR